MTIARVVPTAGLTRPELAEIRGLLERAYEGDFADADWDHAIGGLHAVVAEAGQVVAHAAVVPRRLVHDGRAIRTGYVEAVAVDRPWRGRGYAAAVMAGVEGAIRSSYDMGGLSAAEGVDGLYLARGWLAWQGLTYVAGPSGPTRTPEDDGSTFVLPVPATPPLRLTGTLMCDWREGDVW